MNGLMIPRGIRSLGDRTGSIAKIVLLGLLNALAVWGIAVLTGDRQYVLLAMLILGVSALDFVYLCKRAYPLRFILPGTIFLVLMVIFPILYTIYISFTNLGTGHLLSKDQAIRQYTNRFLLREDLPTYRAEIFKREEADFAFLLTASDGTKLVAAGGVAKPVEEADLKPLDVDKDGIVDRLGPYERQSTLGVFRYLGQLQKLAFKYQGVLLKMRTPQEFASYMPQYAYDQAKDAIIDLTTGTAYYAKDGSFTSRHGESLDIGFRSFIGWRNFKNLLTDRRYSSPFLRVFIWTIIFAAVSVLETFALGLLLAVLLNDPRLRLRGLYRVLLIVPYALPAFITCLIWRGLFQTETGVINNYLIVPLLGRAIPWLQDPFWAKVALLVVNLWLGFPYMMLICLGALQSIPEDLYEAAIVDGATGWQQFKWITLPLVLAALAPLLISSFAFNFNNFNVIYLVTRGRPAIPGSLTPTGATDILISYTYRMAFEGGSGTNYGLAAAVSLVIFLLVGTITALNFRYTKAMEEVPSNE
ncbi:MAG: maltose ABC transporter permease MalF [Bacillota bacterium]